MSQFFNFSLGAVLNEMTRVGVDIGSKKSEIKDARIHFSINCDIITFPVKFV